MSKLKKLLRIVVYTILSLIVFLCLYIFISINILKKDYINIFGYTYFIMESGSMTGTVEINDIVIVKLTNEIKENDIITYKNRNNEYITHRVISINGTDIKTKGDANNIEDDLISTEDVIGEVSLILSPSVLLQLFIILIIIIIVVAIINFDKIFRLFATEEEHRITKSFDKIPDEVFKKNIESNQETITGNTVSIPLKDIMTIDKDTTNDQNVEDAIEILEEVIDIDDNNIITTQTNSKKEQEQELLEQVVILLRIKNEKLNTVKINKKWLVKYQYIYKLANLLQGNQIEELVSAVENPDFEEIYDYDLERAGLYENLKNKIYDMPIYICLRILTFAVLYNDETFFDGVFKIMKYKIKIDQLNVYKELSKDDTYGRKQLKLLLTFMKKIPERFDNKKVFELEKIEKNIKAKKIISNK